MDEPEDLGAIEEAVRGRCAALERRVDSARVAGERASHRAAKALGGHCDCWRLRAVVAVVAGGAVLLSPGRHTADLAAVHGVKPVSSAAPTTPSAIVSSSPTGSSSPVPMTPLPTGRPSSIVSRPPTTIQAPLSGVVALVQQGPLGQAALRLLLAPARARSAGARSDLPPQRARYDPAGDGRGRSGVRLHHCRTRRQPDVGRSRDPPRWAGVELATPTPAPRSLP